MKNIFVFIFAIGIILNGNSQSTSNYTFTTAATASLGLDMNGNAVDLSTGSTSMHGAGINDASGTLTNLNLGTGASFDFFFMGSRYTQFSAGSNGMIQLGTAVSSTAYNIPASTNPVIAPFSGDLATGSDGEVRAKVVGAAPNRCLVVEYYNMMLLWGPTPLPGTGTFQVRLYETTGVIEFVYGSMVRNEITPPVSSVTIGFSSNTTANTIVSINTATHTASTSATVATNTYPISATITDLNSATNGNRRYYRFTPSVPNAPTGLNFTTVTSSAMTLNWTDASNELKYALYRSEDGGSTYTFFSFYNQNVITSGALTALTAGTTYSWKLISISEGAVSTALNADQATVAGTTYYWTGSATAEFNTAATWNTAADGSGPAAGRTSPLSTDILIIDGAGTTAGTIITGGTVNANTTIGILRITDNTSVTLTGVTSTRTITITGGGGDDLDIQSGSLLRFNGATAVAVIFSGTNMRGTIAGALTLGGGTANAITTTGGTGTIVTVTSTGSINNGVAAASGNVTGSAATLVFANGSNYNVSGATSGAPAIPLSTWDVSSNITITGITSSTTAPTNNNQSFGNLTYNCTGATGSMSFFTTTTTAVIKGNLTIQATNTGKFRATTSGTLTINGSLVVNNGTFEVSSTTGTVITNGVTLAGGTLDITSGSGAASLKVSGTFNQTAGTLTRSGTSTTSVLDFNGVSIQNVTILSNANIVTYRVSNNTGINLSGTLSVNTGAGLKISSTSTTPISGGTITYSGTTTLTYDGVGNQTITTSVWPVVNGPSILNLNNTGVTSNNKVSLTINRTLDGANVLVLTSGILVLGVNDLTLGSTATVSGTPSATNMIVSNSTGQLKKIFNGASSFTFPVGDMVGVTQYSPVTLNFSANSSSARTIGVVITDGAPPSVPAGLDYLSRYWAFTDDQAGTYAYTASFNYITGSQDVVGAEFYIPPAFYNGAWNQLTGSAFGGTLNISSSLNESTGLLNGNTFSGKGIPAILYTWDGSADSNWNNGANWDLGVAPTGGNTGVVIPNTPNMPLVTGIPPVGIKNLTIDDPLVTLTINNANFTIGDFVNLNSGQIIVTGSGSGGKLKCNGSLVIGSNFTITENNVSTVESVDTAYVYGGGILTMNNTSKFLSDRGTKISPGAIVTLNNSAEFNELGSFTNLGTLNMNNTTRFYFQGNNLTFGGSTNFAIGSTVDIYSLLTVNPYITIPTMPSPGYGNLTITNTVGPIYTFSQNPIIAGNLVIASPVVMNGGATSNTITVGGNVTLSTTQKIIENANTLNTVLNVGGNFLIDLPGILQLESVSSIAGAAIINISGDFTCIGITAAAGTGANGTIDFGAPGLIAGNTINIAGNFNKSGPGSFGTSSISSATGFVFNKTGTQTFSYSGTNSDYVQYTVSPGSTLQMLTSLALLTGLAPVSFFNVNGTLDMGANQITSTANALFSLGSGGTLKTSHASGITGAVSGFGTRATYHNASNYEFTGSTAITNTNFVNTTMNNLKINNTNTVTLGGIANINGDLNLSAGIFAAGTNLINSGGNILGTATHTNTGAGNITMTGSNKTISGATLGNLILNNAAGFSLTGSPTVKTLTLNPATVLNVNLPYLLTVH